MVRLINVCMCIKFEFDITYMFMVFLILRPMLRQTGRTDRRSVYELIETLTPIMNLAIVVMQNKSQLVQNVGSEIPKLHNIFWYSSFYELTINPHNS